MEDLPFVFSICTCVVCIKQLSSIILHSCCHSVAYNRSCSERSAYCFCACLRTRSCMNAVPRRPKARHGPRNRSGRPGDCRTCNLTNENSYVHISSTFVNAKWTKTHVGKRTHCGPFIIRKISEFDATRCQISKPKCIKFDFRWRSALDPAGGSLQRSPKPPSCI